jgi:hypothetical protein
MFPLSPSSEFDITSTYDDGDRVSEKLDAGSRLTWLIAGEVSTI